MPNPATVREQRLRKTKAQLIDEIDTLERRLTRLEEIGARKANAPAPESSDTGAGASLLEVTENIPEGFSYYDADDRLVLCNKAYKDIFGYSDTEAVPGASYHDLIRLDVARGIVIQDEEGGDGYLRRRKKHRRQAAGAFAIQLADGRWIQIRDRRTALGGMVSIQTDITERKRAEAALKEKTELVQLLHRLATSANEAGDVKEAMQTFLDEVCAHTGWPIGHVYRLSSDRPNTLVPSNIWHLDDPERFSIFCEVTEKTDIEFGFGLPGRVLASGKPAWIVDVTKDPNFPRARLAEDIGVRTGFALPVLVGVEVTGVLEFFTADVVKPDKALLQVLTSIGMQLGRVIERKRAEEEIAHMADHDALTGLPSLRLGMDRAQAAIARARRNDAMAALLFVDLDGFKAVNDTLGHEAGDHVLKGVAERLLASIRETDSLARIGGDEFVVVLTDLNEMAPAASVARKLIDALREPFRYNGQNAVVGASVGIAVYPNHGITTEELIKRADEAMYAVKHKGKNNYQFAEERSEEAARGETGTDATS